MTGVSVVDTVTQGVSGAFLSFMGANGCAEHHPWMSRGVFFGQELPSPRELYLVSEVLCASPLFLVTP